MNEFNSDAILQSLPPDKVMSWTKASISIDLLLKSSKSVPCTPLLDAFVQFYTVSVILEVF